VLLSVDKRNHRFCNECSLTRGRSVSTGLVRESLRVQVPGVLVNPTGNFQLPILNWQWLLKLVTPA
jgi:hypothetical protein